jgi:hypothetical protein
MLGHPLETLVIGFAQETIGHLPQIFFGMDEIEHQDKIRKLGPNPGLQSLTAITQSDLVLDVLSLPQVHLVGQAPQGRIFAVQGGPEVFVLGLGRW